MASIVERMRDLAGLPRAQESRDPKRMEEDARETVRQWMAMAPKVVKHKGQKYTLKPNATVKSGDTVFFKYWAKKPKGEPLAPIVQFVVKYNRGSDLYDVTIESYDENMNKTGERRVSGLGFDNFANFGHLRDVMQESYDPEDAQLADRIREFDKAPGRVRDRHETYGSFDDAIKDMQAQVFDGRRGTEQRPKED